VSTIDKSTSGSKVKGLPASPGKVRGIGGERHEMTIEEMKEKYKQATEGLRHTNLENDHNPSLNTYGAWSNREEEWFFTNKRLMFSTKSSEITDQWVEKLNALVTPE